MSTHGARYFFQDRKWFEGQFFSGRNEGIFSLIVLRQWNVWYFPGVGGQTSRLSRFHILFVRHRNCHRHCYFELLYQALIQYFGTNWWNNVDNSWSNCIINPSPIPFSGYFFFHRENGLVRIVHTWGISATKNLNQVRDSIGGKKAPCIDFFLLLLDCIQIWQIFIVSLIKNNETMKR